MQHYISLCAAGLQRCPSNKDKVDQMLQPFLLLSLQCVTGFWRSNIKFTNIKVALSFLLKLCKPPKQSVMIIMMIMMRFDYRWERGKTWWWQLETADWIVTSCLCHHSVTSITKTPHKNELHGTQSQQILFGSYQRYPWGMWQGYHHGHWAPMIERQLMARAGLQHLRVQGGVQGGSLSVVKSGVCWEGCWAVMSVHLPVEPVAFCES